MAMEVKPRTSQSKQLHKHAVPIIMVAVLLLTAPVFMIGVSNGIGFRSRTQIVRNPGGLIEIIRHKQSPADPAAGSVLRADLTQTGQSAQLSLDLQTLPTSK